MCCTFSYFIFTNFLCNKVLNKRKVESLRILLLHTIFFKVQSIITIFPCDFIQYAMHENETNRLLKKGCS